MTIEEWEISDELKQELSNHYKTVYSVNLAPLPAEEIARKLTFDGLVKNVTPKDLIKFLDILNTRFANGKIKGVGLEIGSGPGTFVAALATMPSVEKVYGVEACEAIVRELMDKVVAFFAGADSKKIVGAIADFDHLSVPDASIDFVFDFFSLHHSPNPAITIKELARVLRPGGIIICVDKARANTLTEDDLEKLLDSEYTREAKIAMGISPDTYHTRRMNGEREYRLKDWNCFFTEAGMSTIEHYNVAKIGGLPPVRFVKKILARLPIRIQRTLSGFISKKVTNNLEPTNRIFSNIFPVYPREFSLMISKKL